MKIRRLDKGYQEQVRHLYEKTFVEDGPGFVGHYFDQYLDMDNVIGVFDEKVTGENDADEKVIEDVQGKSLPTLRCMLHLNPYQVMWQGQLYKTSYVVAVATDEAYRRKGYMRDLLTWTLRERYEAGEVFSLLMPIDSRYYDQFGYGFIQDVEVYKFYYGNLRRGFRPIPIKELRAEESIELLSIYNQYKSQFNLSHNRGMRALDLLIQEAHSEGGQVVMVPDGYVIYYSREASEGTEASVFVRESCYTSSEGLLNILDYIGSIAGDREIEWQMPSMNPLKHLVPHMSGHSVERKPFIMARIINVYELLVDMAEMIGDCVIKVIDGQIFENNGVYQVNGSQVSKGEEGANEPLKTPDITIDVESLAQWLFGYESLENLAYVRKSVSIHRDVIYYPELPILTYFNEFV